MTARNLTVDTAVPWLLERGLVDEAAIVESDLQVVDAGRRNQNLKVIRRRGPSYLLKQPGEGEHGTEASLRREAAFYEHCATEPRCAEVRALLPAFHGFEPERGLLVLDLLQARPPWSHDPAARPPSLRAEAAAPLGAALGVVHRVFRDRAAWARWMAALPADPPWILFAHRPTPEVLERLSPANAHVLSLLQQDEGLAAGLDTLRAAWSPDTLVHGDVKADNVLLLARASGGTQVALVDWELVQPGEAAWDVGSALRDLLWYWLATVPLSRDVTPEQMLEGAGLPLAALHPAARAFWGAYRDAARVDGPGPFLGRALRYAAARLAQGAYELSVHVNQAPNLAMAALQLAANILSDP
jgi:Phosphotransferase enzyme family